MSKLGSSSRGWVSIGAGAGAMLWGSGLALSTFGVFMPWFIKEFGWARSEVSGALSICMMLVTVSGPVAGFYVAKFGPRVAFCTGQALVGAAFLLLAFDHSLWQLYVAYALIGAGHCLGGIIAGSTLSANWFGEKASLGISVFIGAGGIGAFFLVPLAEVLIGNIGWRNVCVIFSGVAFLFAVFIPFVLVRDKPRASEVPEAKHEPALEQKSIEPKSAGVALVALTLKQALRNARFWLLTAAGAVSYFVMSFFMSHQVAYLAGAGVSSNVAAMTLGTISAGTSVGTLVVGALSLRFSVKSLMLVASSTLLVSTALAFFIPWTPLAFVFSVLLGCAHAGVLVCSISLFNTYFGTAHFSEILGVSQFLKVVAVLGAPVGGLLFDAQGTYFTALIVMAVTAALGLVCAVAALSQKGRFLGEDRSSAASAASL